MMKKNAMIACALSAWIVGCSALSLSACGVKATQAGSIDDVTKGYFAGDETASTLQLDLSEYVEANGAQITYEASSENEDVATANVDGNTLSATLLSGTGSSEITVNVNSDGKFAFSLSFTLTATTYDSVVCVGDSLTEGHSWGSQSYPVYLQEALGADIKVTNCGKNGASITGYGGTQQKYDTLSQYTQSFQADPDVVILMLGTNDAKGWANAEATFETEYRELIASYKQANEDVQIILVTSPPTMESNAFSIPNDVIKTSVNPVQRAVAEELDLPLLDARELFEAREGGYESLYRPNDGVHFSVEGAQWMAELVAEAVKAL